MKKLLTLFQISFLAGCVTTSEISITHQDLPIFNLESDATDEQVLEAYKEQLDLMILYSQELEDRIPVDHDENIKMRGIRGPRR